MIQKFSIWIDRKKYELLLVSFLLLIFGDTFSESRTVNVADIYQNFMTGLIVFMEKRWLRYFILLIVIFNLGLDGLGYLQYHGEVQNLHMDMRSWHGIVYLIFFTAISREVYKEVLYAKVVNRELLAASLCGFVILCLMATFIFYQIEIKHSHSFANVGEKNQVLMNLNYFGFTTLLTIGYGDITPLSLLAKRAVMLVGLLGHFYTVFIMSIIIGKYLRSNKA